MKRAAVLTAALAALVVSPAHATFPGRNGSIVWVEQQPGPSPSRAELHALNPATGVDRRVWECGTSPVGMDASCTGATSPATSPDGHIALVQVYNQFLFPGPGSARTLRIFDSQVRVEWAVPLPPAVDFRLDGGGRRLHFLNDGATLLAEVYSGAYALPYLNRLVGTDGTVGPQVGPDNAEAFDWSVDGRAVFAHDGDLVVMSRAGVPRRLTPRGGSDPSWSPRGRWIAFTRKHDLYVVDSRGGRARRLTRRGADWPVWSPNGRTIAFVRWKPHRTDKFGYEGVPYLYVLDVRRGRARQLLDRPLPMDRFYATPPEWQPLPR